MYNSMEEDTLEELTSKVEQIFKFRRIMFFYDNIKWLYYRKNIINEIS